MMNSSLEQKVAHAEATVAWSGATATIVLTIATAIFMMQEGYHPIVSVVFGVIIGPIGGAIALALSLSDEDKKVLEAKERIEKEELENYLRSNNG